MPTPPQLSTSSTPANSTPEQPPHVWAPHSAPYHTVCSAAHTIALGDSPSATCPSHLPPTKSYPPRKYMQLLAMVLVCGVPFLPMFFCETISWHFSSFQRICVPPALDLKHLLRENQPNDLCDSLCLEKGGVQKRYICHSETSSNITQENCCLLF